MYQNIILLDQKWELDLPQKLVTWKKMQKKKLEEKNCDWIIANDVSNKTFGFDSSFNEVSIYYKDKSMNDETLTIKSKSEISDEIIDRVIKKLN